MRIFPLYFTNHSMTLIDLWPNKSSSINNIEIYNNKYTTSSIPYTWQYNI